MKKNKRVTDLVLKVLDFTSNIVLTNPCSTTKTGRPCKKAWSLKFHFKEFDCSKKPFSRTLFANKAEPPHL